MIKEISFQEIVRPLRVTFATAKGRKNMMRSIIVRVALADGSSGLGECPSSISFGNETMPVTKGILDKLKPKLIGMPIENYETAMRLFRKKYTGYPMTISGLEVALFRANLAHREISEHSYWGGKTRSVHTDITIPFMTDKGLL